MLKGLVKFNRVERQIFRLAKKSKLVRIRQIGVSRRTKDGLRFPIWLIEIGKPSAVKKKPVGLVAGIHGLEKIGVQILVEFLEELLDPRSPCFMKEVEDGEIGILVVPVANPGGFVLNTRSNPAGVDLMRNSGDDAKGAPFFFGGHFISPMLPYYRGLAVQPEARTLRKLMRDNFYGRRKHRAIVLDIHSGFGRKDSIWWPFASSDDRCPHESAFEDIRRRLHHDGHTGYEFGPQSASYKIHGDLWDSFYRESLDSDVGTKKNGFMPMTLEIGTWAGLGKNPKKIFNKKRLFNLKKKDRPSAVEKYKKLLRDIVLTAVV